MSGHREESRGVGRPSWAAGAVAALVAATGAIAAAPADDWRPLFDGAKLGDWRATEFGGEGAVEVVGDAIRIGMGSPLSGITWGGEFPRQRFELSLEARRVEGHDFFCGLTFPVGPDSCSLILGGWGGGLVGLSSIDGEDASSNQTTQYREFKLALEFPAGYLTHEGIAGLEQDLDGSLCPDLGLLAGRELV